MKVFCFSALMLFSGGVFSDSYDKISSGVPGSTLSSSVSSEYLEYASDNVEGSDQDYAALYGLLEELEEKIEENKYSISLVGSSTSTNSDTYDWELLYSGYPTYNSSISIPDDAKLLLINGVVYLPDSEGLISTLAYDSLDGIFTHGYPLNWGYKYTLSGRKITQSYFNLRIDATTKLTIYYI